MTSRPPTPLIRLAISQSHTLPTLATTLSALKSTTQRAASTGIDLLLFPEAYLGGYPRGATFGSRIGAREAEGREQFLSYWREAVDLGGESGRGGDGTREYLEDVARETGVFVVVGLVERAGGTLYCSVVYVCPTLGVIGKRRKVMPTGTERIVWGQGQPSSLRAVTTTIRGVKLTLAAAICWENYMPLLRQSLYSQNVNLYLAPTADARDTWLSLMRTVACEGRCFVLSANQCVREKDLPEWISGKTVEEDPAEDEVKSEMFHRRRSVITETGNEIALPMKRKEVPEEALLDEEEEHDPAHHRRKSFITEHGHEIVFPAIGENGQQETDSRGEGDTNDLRRLRRASFITEDGHEIALPSGRSSYYVAKVNGGDHEATNGAAPKKRQSYLTEEGHEIVCPAVAKSKLAAAAVNGHGVKKTKATESKTESTGSSPFACRGGSCIISPNGDVLAGPVWEMQDELIVVDVDFDDCIRGRLDIDVAGSYSRNDAFKLTVEGLDLSPPL